MILVLKLTSSNNKNKIKNYENKDWKIEKKKDALFRFEVMNEYDE